MYIGCDLHFFVSQPFIFFLLNLSILFRNLFRFYGRISQSPNNYDPKTIQAICANIDGLQKISGERIWTELKKILQGNYRLELFAKLIECGAARYIGKND